MELILYINNMSRKLTTQEFIEKARKVHGNKYDYSKAVYNTSKEKIIIICPKHGEFLQRPNDHLNGNGCPYCNTKNKSNTEEYIKKATQVHNGYFNYDKTEYINANSKIIVTCPVHGDFEVKANNHLNGQNCIKCEREGLHHNVTKLIKNNNRTKKLTKGEVIDRIHNLFGDKYTIPDFEYINNSKPITLYCNEVDDFGFEHGEFKITPLHLFSGEGCPKCGKNYRMTTDEFINRANLIHENKYDYSKTEYKTTHKNVTIICPEHGNFHQSPANHLKGQGCPLCTLSKLENDVKTLLDENNIKYIQQKTFYWLKKEKNLYLDFYLPDYSIAIECQGEQHFKPIKFSNSINENTIFEKATERDVIKNKLCSDNNIKILYYSRVNYPGYMFNLITSKNELINEILNK